MFTIDTFNLGSPLGEKSGLDLFDAKKFLKVFPRVQSQILPARQAAAASEEARNKEVLAADAKAKVNRHHANFLKKWWQMSYARADLMQAIRPLKRYIACGRYTKRPIFEFISTEISPNDALTVFAHDDDYSFGILQSTLHWEWFTARCSTIKSDPRYTSNTVFDTFAWPQAPSLAAVRTVASAAVALREGRRQLRVKHAVSYRELYRTLEMPGSHPMKDVQAKLDEAVQQAYGMGKKADTLGFLLKLNHEVAAAEKAGKPVQGPGLPNCVEKRTEFVTADCVKP